VSVLESQGNGAFEIRYAPLAMGSAEALRNLTKQLERRNPAPFSLQPQNTAEIIESLSKALEGDFDDHSSAT
jgi:hypothetical protein